MVDATDIVSGLAQSRNEALPQVVGNIDEDPERAQRSWDLAKITGVPATAIHPDLDDFERNTKAKMASDIVANNPHISTFVQSDPMVPKIFANSYGFLDDVSSAVSKLSLGRVGRGIVSGFGDQPIGNQLLPRDETFGPENRLSESILRAGASVPELFLRTVSAGIKGISYGLLGDEKGENVAQVLMDPGLQATLHGMGPAGAVAAGFSEALGKVARSPGLKYVENGKVPPPGLMPEVDKMLVDQNGKDIERLMDATKASGTVPERTTNPELYRQFIADHTDAEIGISGDAVAALYGDKVPLPDDNLLGWVPGIEGKIALAKSTGDDVHIPLADWLTHIPDYPDVMKALEDDIRVRPEGITKNEVEMQKALDEAVPKAEPLPDIVPTVRSAGALEPMLSVGDRKLQMERRPIAMKGDVVGADEWRLLDEKGNKVGHLEISPFEGGKKLYVDVVQGLNGLGPRDFGPALMRDMLRQIKAAYPQAEQIGGYRISGAREVAGTEKEAWIKLARTGDFNLADHEAFRQILEGGQWETFSPSTQAYIKPQFERSQMDRQLVDMVNEEANRIVPKTVHVRTAETIKVDAAGVEGQRAGEDIAASGIYIRYKHTYPVILAALDSGDTLGTFRHEAIHHLRNYGFFSKNEWGILEKAAEEGGWKERYNTDRLYPTGDRALKLEESIAERYKDWVRDGQIEGMTAETISLFQRIKDFFEAIRNRIGQMLGKDPTWEDIFKKVDTGEVGSRVDTLPLDARAFNKFDEKLSVTNDSTNTPKSAADFPAIEQDKVRFYHGTLSKDASSFSGKTFLTPSFDYAKNYHGNFNNVLYVDLTREEAIKKGLWDEVNDYPINGPIDDGANQLKSVVGSSEGKANTPVVYTSPEGSARDHERAQSLGMTVKDFKAYDKRMTERHLEDIQKATERATAEKSKELTKEWKANRVDVRKEVADNIRNRPDVAVDLFLAGDGLYGRRTKMAYRLDADKLTEKQKAMLPKEYYKSGGLNPDDVANMFGYGSGDAMVEKLTNYNINRRMANMSSKDYVSRITDIETDRQMKLRYGNLDENIMDQVKEQVVGDTAQNLVHEETLYYGNKIGQRPATRENILAAVKQEFSKQPIGSISSDRLMKRIGQQGRTIEALHLKEDWEGAFRAAQQREYTMAVAKEARQVEKDIGKFNKVAKRFAKREVTGVDPEYTNFIHDILQKVGKPVRRSIQDVETEIAAGEYHTLQEFVEGKSSFGLREIAVSDDLYDPNFRTAFGDLTVEQFNGLNTSIKSLVKNGRDELKITKAGTEADLKEVKSQMIEQLAQFQERTYDVKGGRWMGPIPPSIAKVLRNFGTAHIQMENLFNRWDKDNPQGIFQQYIMRDLVDASNNENVMEKRYAERVRGLDDKADLKKSVDNPIFKVPHTNQLMKFNRGNLRAIMMNVGNESNLVKLAKGYGISREEVMGWVHKYAEKADWDWAQKMGDIFADLKAEADVMYRHLSGVAPESLPLSPIDTLHGQYKGWYYPVMWHPEFEGPSKKLMGKNALEQENYVRATVANSYTKQRTGYAGPMALDLDMLPARMKQMVHDIAMRPSVINASKIFYDKDVRGAISKHFGNEWRDMLVPYLVDVANSANYVPKDQRMFYNASEFLRQNLVSTLVGLNPGTVMKHGPTAAVQSLNEVGTVNFLRALKGMFSIDERTGESNWQFAMKESEELQRRHQNYTETLGGATDLLQPTTGYASLRATVQRYSSMPVAMSDLLSAVPTWLAQYEKSMAENGGIHGDAVYDANRAVRRAHGSVAITNRSTVMRGGAMGQWFASVYGFFNHIMNRQYELVWKSGETLDMVKDGKYAEAMQRAPELTAMLFAYVLAPALIEEMVTPLTSSDNESWGKKAAKGIAFTLGASWVGVRDIANAMLNGRDPSVGLISTFGKTMTDFIRDVNKTGPLNKEHAGKIVRDGATMLGGLTGVVPAQAGKAVQFGIGVAQGTEKPKGPWGWMVGARYGTIGKHSGTFEEWQKHH